MTMHARDGGTWRTITLPSVRVAGVWTAVSGGWTRVSGVWQQFYSAVLDTQTLTIGTFSFKAIAVRGFNSANATGSISDGTFNPISNATIEGLHWTNIGNTIRFEVQGVRANSGWTNMRLYSVDYARSAATFSDNGGSGPTSWSWGSSDPFGADSSTVDAVFS